MAPIYSRKLVNALYAAPTTAVVYTVPAATTVVVTDVDFLISGASGQYFTIALGAAYVIWMQLSGSLTQHFQWTGKQVLNAGDQISMLNGDIATLAITGYVLS
jgi:hypothetical protein